MSALLRRREVVAELLKDRRDLLAVAGLGAPAWDLTQAGDHELNYPLWGAMGGAAALGLGLALAQPKRAVLVVTGDGEMLMGLGTLATIAVQQPPNLSVIVLDNGRYGETGMQPTHTDFGVDLAGIAKAAGFPLSYRVERPVELAQVRALLHAGRGPLFASVKVDSEKLPLVLPPRDGAYLKTRMRKALLGDAALHD